MNAEKTAQVVNLIKDYIVHANNVIWEKRIIYLITYSGRGMCGEFCYAIVAHGLESYHDFLSDIEDYAEEKQIAIEKDVFRALRKAKTDSLGYNTVYYCPSLAKIDGLEP
jgi:F0F1-type ATP synthase gamma subunit